MQGTLDRFVRFSRFSLISSKIWPSLIRALERLASNRIKSARDVFIFIGYQLHSAHRIGYKSARLQNVLKAWRDSQKRAQNGGQGSTDTESDSPALPPPRRPKAKRARSSKESARSSKSSPAPSTGSPAPTAAGATKAKKKRKAATRTAAQKRQLEVPSDDSGYNSDYREQRATKKATRNGVGKSKKAIPAPDDDDDDV